MSINLVLATFFAFVLLVNGNPVDNIEEKEIILCPEGAANGRKTILWDGKKKKMRKFRWWWWILIPFSYYSSLQWLMVSSFIRGSIDVRWSAECAWRVISAGASCQPMDSVPTTSIGVSSAASNVSRIRLWRRADDRLRNILFFSRSFQSSRSFCHASSLEINR